MKKLLPFVVAPLTFAAVGYAAGSTLVPEASLAAEEAHATPAAAPGDEAVDEASADGHTTPDGPAGDAYDTQAEAPGQDEHVPVLRLGRITVPIQQPRTITYIVLDLALAFESQSLADSYRADGAFTALRDASLSAIHRAAERQLMQGATVDSERLSSFVTQEVAAAFPDVQDVLFLTLYKQAVPRT
ncbi:hypothetical protein OG2516_06836 [Oceanicola granulosus HTCC2516]|uniref:Flagellar protein FliL n=2 Tax=Oceanicola granulosus TaxID=252302 RepID=Q2CGF9_OCEGH|nr:hypothetical protein OG2516_06836 [Oceanicola granulosus HTCC2516]